MNKDFRMINLRINVVNLSSDEPNSPPSEGCRRRGGHSPSAVSKHRQETTPALRATPPEEGNL